MNNEVEVSIYCLAFNHGKYIRQTLEGFVKQKTSFRYEVIVHDDASSDDTSKIIEEYALRYPDIIKPIYQNENQYSKGISILTYYIEPVLQSTKYYAICEGDDYWIEENKLQMQYEYMETHNECSMCVHNTKRITEDGSDTGIYFNSRNTDTDYNTEAIIVAGGGGLFHTSSFFWRTEYGIYVPDSFSVKGVGDYNRAIYLSTLGYVHYIGKVMSAYRQGSINSWVKKTAKDKLMHARHYEVLVDALKCMNKATNEKYEEAFMIAIYNYQFTICEIRKDYQTIFNDPILYKIYKSKTLKQKIKIRIKMLLLK